MKENGNGPNINKNLEKIIQHSLYSIQLQNFFYISEWDIYFFISIPLPPPTVKRNTIHSINI